ncbi:MAG: cytochrome c3 family protein [Gemmatimonadota bacterium]
MGRRVRFWGVTLGWVALVASAAPVSAQLISPGKLTDAHASLEGIRNCTQCHELRQKGISRSLCLDCHEPLAARISGDKGFHARLDEQDCGVCHKEHAGREADIVRFDTDGFAHAREVGFELEGAHGTLECTKCHNRDLVQDVRVRRFKAAQGAGLDHTFLGLGTECLSCHRSDDPHDGQFGDRTCTDCHGQEEWEGAVGFDHDDARFKLTGLHRQVECVDCHPSEPWSGSAQRLRFRPLSFGTCLDCHEDNHDGAMGAECTKCHGTQGWDRISRNQFEGDFDHASTGFELVDAHAGLECMNCHRPAPESRDRIAIQFAARTRMATYPRPVVDRECLSCHVDQHGGEFAEPPAATDCTSCHDQTAWLPSEFDLFRHQETAFPLVGAHLAVECSGCHVPDDGAEHLRFDMGERTCAQCHVDDDPHEGQFEGRACTDCHNENAFVVPGFDHDQTSYPLDGAHRDLACASCHLQEEAPDGRAFIRFRPLASECRDCHGGEDR